MRVVHHAFDLSVIDIFSYDADITHKQKYCKWGYTFLELVESEFR